MVEDALDPLLGEVVRLDPQPRPLHGQVAGYVDPEVLQRAPDDRLVRLGELLVGQLQGLDPEAEEVGVPRGVVRREQADEVVDGAEGEDRLGRGVAARAVVLPRLRLHRPPQRDGLADLVLPGDAHVAEVREHAGEQVGDRQPRQPVDPAQQRGEVAEVAPHQLGAEDAVGGGALVEGPRQVAAVGLRLPQLARLRRALGHLAEGEPLHDVGVPARVEVLVRSARQARVQERLEVLLRMTRDAGLVEQVAQQRAAAARRRAHEVGQGRGAHLPLELSKDDRFSAVCAPRGCSE